MGKDIATQDYQKHKAQFYRVFERFYGSKGRKLEGQETVLDGYWHSLGGYPIDLLSKALDAIALREDAFMPDAGHVIAEMSNIRSSDRSTVVPTHCDICHSTGMILVTKVYNGYPYSSAHRCDCSNGQRIDRRIQPISMVGMMHSEPEDATMKKLPITTLQDLRDSPSHRVWGEGVEVTKICADCGKPYSVRHERPVSVGELQDFHLNRTRPHQCELCFVEEGRKRGAWL